jgi:hypothetical protein
MTTYAFPTLTSAPSRWRFGQRSNTFAHVSSQSGGLQTIEIPGARWTITGSFTRVGGVDRALLDSFFTKQRGQANRFTHYDISYPVPRGTMRGSPTVNGAHASGVTSVSINAGAGQGNTTLKEGDRIKLGPQLCMVVADVTLNGSGVGSLTVEPPIRIALSNGAPVVWDRPLTNFVLASPQWSGDIEPDFWASFEIEAFEDLTGI